MIAISRLVALLALWGVTQPPSASTDVGVGIVAYEDFRGEYERFEQLFAELSRREPSLRFRIAMGSYGDVLQWIDRRMVDVAILTPGVFAGLLPPEPLAHESTACRYLATVQIPPATSKWASAARRAEGFQSTYRSVCLVSDSSTLQSVDDLQTAARQGKLEFLFVHPLSVSGRAVPLESLRKLGIQPTKEQVRFTYSHSQSIRILGESPLERQRVAFVWDDAAGNDSDLETGVRRLEFPDLDRLEIPRGVVVAQVEFQHADLLRERLLEEFDHLACRFQCVDDWQTVYRPVRKWLAATGALASVEEGEPTSLDEIGQLLLHFARSQPRPPRLALVLSGGGAKCSYQVGAVAAVEEELAQLRRDNPQQGLDISLVVGTSGGAINSVPIAMGISSSDEGRQAFRETWQGLDQREIVRPSLAVRANMGIWLALLQTALVVWAVRRFIPQPDRRGRTFAVVYMLLAVVEILLGYFPISPWRWLGTNHVWHHAWLWLSFGVRVSAWSLLAIGGVAFILEAYRSRRGRHIAIPEWSTRTTLAVGLLGLPLVQLLTIFGLEKTLSGGQGMERTLADEFPRLIDRYLELEKLSPLYVPDRGAAAGRLQAVSRQIVERGLLKRDLVITGSCLQRSSDALPSDLYFFAPCGSSNVRPGYGDRGLSLSESPHLLLDVVMGSGSIFPVFPPRTIEALPRAGERIELVDGGFAHNSPLEAAVLWGATHIVLLEATPYQRTPRGNLLRNVTSSFRHLHRQAQLLDARSRGKVIVFSLAPQPPHICVLDFADNLVAASIERGYDDARTDPASPALRFRKELGEPVFFEVLPATTSIDVTFPRP